MPVRFPGHYRIPHFPIKLTSTPSNRICHRNPTLKSFTSTRKMTTKTQSPKVAFILDFDGTITTKDTISTLFKIGLSKQASLGIDKSQAHEEIISSYGDEFSKHVQNYRPVKEERTKLWDEFDYHRSLRDVEVRSFERVSTSGVFAGISESEWEEFGRQAVRNGDVIIRNGFAEFCRAVEKQAGVWGVVSVNFSRGFIRGVLEEALKANTRVDIFSNVLDERGIIERSKIEGWMPSKEVIATSDFKLAAMHCLIDTWKKSPIGKYPLHAVYIGDSGTDIECLMDDSVQEIIMAESSSSPLIDILARLGIGVRNIEGYPDSDDDNLLWARDFAEISQSKFLVCFHT
ncbi:hypothetical protein B0J14DRAFT_586505 [Halenospora varia]|nr:hypothetical protein B0J14DRAFT_586505 [Halenospora varia]